MRISVKQLFMRTLTHRQVLDLLWLRERRLKNLYDLKDNKCAERAGMKHNYIFEPPSTLVKLGRAYPNHLAFTEPYLTWITKERRPMTSNTFVHGPGPRATKLIWPDFWYMHNERRSTLAHLQDACEMMRLNGFRRSALYTSAAQVKEHVALLHQGKRNTYH